MGSFIDLAGKIVGRLTVIGPCERRGNRTYWKCRCSCDEKTEKYVFVSSLTAGVTQSCGCIRKEQLIKRSTKHDKASSTEYIIWQGMKDRCGNPNSLSYKGYGGRGIYIDSSWLVFENFYRDMGDRPRGKSLGRIDNDGPYKKENCRWETQKQQSNNKRNTRYLTLGGETKTLDAWSEALNIHPGTLGSRIARGKTADQVLKPYSKGMNTRKDATLVWYEGKEMPLTEVAHSLGLSPKLLQLRYFKGWRGDQLFCPVMKRGGHNNLKYKNKKAEEHLRLQNEKEQGYLNALTR